MNEKQMQDMAVSILLDEYTQLDVAQLLKENGQNGRNSEISNMIDGLDKKCAKMIRCAFRNKRRKRIAVRISKALSRVAVAVLAIIGLCSVSVLAVEAWREPALRFVLETFDRRSSVSMEGDMSNESTKLETIAETLTAQISSHYNLDYKQVGEGYCRIKYTGNSNQIIKLTASIYRHEGYFDTEHTEGTKIQINGYEALLIEKNGYSLIWLDEELNIMFDLYTNALTQEELLDLASVL